MIFNGTLNHNAKNHCLKTTLNDLIVFEHESNNKNKNNNYTKNENNQRRKKKKIIIKCQKI